MFTYQFFTKNLSSMFHIDPNTGTVRTVVCLDYEKTPSVVIPLIAVDKGVPKLTSDMVATINLTVLNVNDSPPMFSQDVYNVTVLLPTFDDVTVTKVLAVDADLGSSDSGLTYAIAEGNVQGIYAIDERSGLIHIKDKNKAKGPSFHKLKVMANDGKYTSEAFVNIKWIQNYEDKGLSFEKKIYLGAVLENSTQSITVAVVSVKGALLNDHVVFSILNPQPQFTIGHVSGAVKTTGIPLDREVQEFYSFVIQAERVSESFEESPGWHIARTMVNVTVLDINDNCPVVINKEAHAVISQSVRKHHFVIRVMAHDADKEENGEVHFELENHNDIFKICPRSGNITIKQQVPSHIFEYKLNIAIRDNGIPPCTTKSSVHVSVLDEDTPIFEQQYYQAYVPEDITIHTPIPLTLRTFSPLTNDIIYSIVEGDLYDEFQTAFSAGSSTGTSPCVIRVKSILDYESTDTYTLKIRATDAVTGKYSDTVVGIFVQDVNDNAPEFLQDIYNVSVPETLNIGGFVGQVHAIDRDIGLNGVVRYAIDTEMSHSYSWFYVRSGTGEVFLKKTLDYETKPFYSLWIKAFDTGTPSKSSYAKLWIHVVDVVDTGPVVSEPIVGLLYGMQAARGQFVSLIRSFHSVKNVKLSYSLLSHDNTFNLDKESGTLTISNPSSMSWDDMKVNFSVTDGVYTTTSSILVRTERANEMSPKFENYAYEVTIKENTPRGSHMVTLRASDSDIGQAGHIKYSIPSKTARETFKINQNSGEITTTKPLDREIEPYHEFLVQVTDPGKRTGLTSVLVTVVDVNDNSPKFIIPKYFATVFPGTPQNSTILQVEANDVDDGPNGLISYSLVGTGKVAKLFAVDSNSGNVSIKFSPSFMQENMYQFFVQATDSGNPPLSTDVPINVFVSSAKLDFPTSSKQSNSFFVSESAEKGSLITILEKSFEEKVTYTIYGKTKSIIRLKEDGKVILAQTLDREEVAIHKLAVLVEASTNPPISYVTHLKIHVLDVNDNKPKFELEKYEVDVMEGTAEGERILKVKAFDSDEGKNGEVHYWLEDNLGMFMIDRRTGWVTTHADLDREKQSKYILNVVAFDNGNPALSDKATIHLCLLDANDNPPVFKQKSWNISVPEDSPVGTFLLELETTDEDEKSEKQEFYIVSGDKDCKFAINSQGKMFLMKTVDREETSQFIITVLVTDGKFTASTSIVIHVLDVNDEKPQCLKEVYVVQLSEDVPLFSYVTTVEAFDPDSEPNYHFFLHEGHEKYFSINNITGELRTNALLDRERISQHNVVIYVADKDNETWRCKSTVVIKLMDVNDCAPKFEMDNITASVVENAPIGSVVTMLLATDADLASNAKVKYSLIDSSKGIFKIDSKSGLVQLMGTVDREEKDTYVLIVRASDETAPELFSNARLIITVLDINDNPPIFSQKVYHSQVSESAPVNTQFMKMEAYSADIGANAEVFYSIVSGDAENNFMIDPSSGVLSVAKLLDYENIKSYMVTVEARDLGEPPLSTQALVNISVIDSNDNTPIFLQSLYTTVVPEDMAVGSTVLQVIASDADSGKNGRIVYSIEKGDVHNQFNIDPNSGFVIVTSPLDREQKDTYKLLMRATDEGNVPLSSTANVVIEISDVNDNPPRFTSSNYTAFIQEGKRAGWSILKLEVRDSDLGRNGGPFEFDIQSGNENNSFSISADGTIKSNTVLTDYIHKIFNLQIRVYDSGNPPLYSDTVVTVKVTEESLHPPLVSPLNVVVMSYENQLRKCSLGMVHTRDADPYDTHAYTLEGEPNGFFIDPMTGHLSMDDLDPGVYYLNVTVTDGKFSSSAMITVTIQSIFRNMLLSAFSLRFKGMTPKYFLLTGWKTILRLLKKLLKTEILLLSLQPANRDLDVLLSFQEYVSLEELNKVVSETRLAVVLLKCNCQNGGKCKQSVTIVPHRITTTSTESETFVAAEHTHLLFCTCSPAYSGEFCEEEACECPPPTLCSHQGGTMVCTSPPPVAPLCADNRTCDSADDGQFSYVYPYIVILLLAAILLSAVAAISVILWKRKRERARNNEEAKTRKAMFRDSQLNCPSKISNIKASQGIHPSSYNNGSDTLYSALPLNNLENSRNCGLDDSESITCDYLQNINPSMKIRNVENPDVLESPKQAFEMASYGFPQPIEGISIPRIEDQ